MQEVSWDLPDVFQEKKTNTKQTVVACVINLRSSVFLLVSSSPAHMFSCCVAALFGLRVL